MPLRPLDSLRLIALLMGGLSSFSALHTTPLFHHLRLKVRIFHDLRQVVGDRENR